MADGGGESAQREETPATVAGEAGETGAPAAEAGEPVAVAGEPVDAGGADEAARAALLDPTQPLDAAARAVLWGTPQDDPPEILDASRPELEGRHYMSSDEWNLHLFEPVLRDLGGAYMGVGTDQGYLLIGWQRPAFAYLADYDPWVTVLHWVYFAFFEQAETPDALMALFAREADGLAALRSHYANHPQLALMEEIYDRYRGRVLSRLRRLEDKLDAAGVAGFVNDEAQYAFVRSLVRSGRVRPLQSNLLADQGVQGIAAALHQTGIPLRAFYVSNAEEYWKWTEGHYVANLKALPFDEKSLVLRTLASHPVNDDYRYNVQPALSFLPWLEDPRIPPEVIYMIPRRKLDGPDDIEYLFFDEPPEHGVARMQARRERKQRGE